MRIAIALFTIAAPHLLAAQTIDDVVEWTGTLELEETEAVLSARPNLSADPAGGFLVADQMENQVRRYDATGNLLFFFGREGEGPGEFQGLVDVARQSNGHIAAVTSRGKLSVWSEDGEEVLQTIRVPPRMSSVNDLGSSIAVVGVPIFSPEDMNVPIVHLIPLGEDEVEGGIVYPTITEENASAFGTVVGPVMEGFGRRKAVIAPVVDTIWIVDSDSQEVVRKMGIDSERLSENEEAPDPRRDRAGFREWVMDSWFVLSAHPLPGSGWLVSLWKNPGPDVEWTLLKLDDTGQRDWEVSSDAPLETIDSEGRLIFRDPGSIVPGRFRIGRLKN